MSFRPVGWGCSASSSAHIIIHVTPEREREGEREGERLLLGHPQDRCLYGS